jgi:hypothetical protein
VKIEFLCISAINYKEIYGLSLTMRCMSGKIVYCFFLLRMKVDLFWEIIWDWKIEIHPEKSLLAGVLQIVTCEDWLEMIFERRLMTDVNAVMVFWLNFNVIFWECLQIILMVLDSPIMINCTSLIINDSLLIVPRLLMMMVIDGSHDGVSMMVNDDSWWWPAYSCYWLSMNLSSWIVIELIVWPIDS